VSRSPFSRPWTVCGLAAALLASTLLAGHAGPVQPAAPSEMKPVGVFQGHTRAVFHAVYSPDGTHVATSGKDHVVRLWDAATHRCLRELKGHTDSVYGVSFSPDGRRLATASADRHLRVWSVPAGEQLLRLAAGGEQFAVAFSPDGRKIAVVGSGTVALYDAVRGTLLRRLAGHTDRVLGVAFSPDGRRLATSCGTAGYGGTAGGEVKLWDVDKGDQLAVLPGVRGVLTVAFSPDGRRLAGACIDGTVKLWEVATGQETIRFKGHTLEVYKVAFSPDSRRLASCSGLWNGSRPGEVKVWDLTTGKEVLGFHGHTRPIWSVAFRPDGKRLLTATGSWDGNEAGEAREWDLAVLRPMPPAPAAPTQKQLNAWWTDLASPDAARAYRAVWAMSLCPKQTLAFLKDQARPPARMIDTQRRIGQLIADLDSKRFKVREKAQLELERLGRAAHPGLKKALESPSAEVRRRAERILEKTATADGPPPLQPEELRLIRAIEVLQKIGTTETKPTLERLAASTGNLAVATEASLALSALGKVPRP
jgi:dipeptidyl aminopeptidase/acylaminoacyl peptidase